MRTTKANLVANPEDKLSRDVAHMNVFIYQTQTNKCTQTYQRQQTDMYSLSVFVEKRFAPLVYTLFYLY